VLKIEDYEKVLGAARELASERHIMTAGYGGMDVAQEAYDRSGVESDCGVNDMTTAQVHGTWDAFHGTELKPSAGDSSKSLE
jgi:hypothetical protein